MPLTCYIRYGNKRKKVRELCDLLYTPAKREQMISMSPEPADEKEVMGKTRFVYLDENAGEDGGPLYESAVGTGDGLYR